MQVDAVGPAVPVHPPALVDKGGGHLVGWGDGREQLAAPELVDRRLQQQRGEGQRKGQGDEGVDLGFVGCVCGGGGSPRSVQSPPKQCGHANAYFGIPIDLRRIHSISTWINPSTTKRLTNGWVMTQAAKDLIHEAGSGMTSAIASIDRPVVLGGWLDWSTGLAIHGKVLAGCPASVTPRSSSPNCVLRHGPAGLDKRLQSRTRSRTKYILVGSSGVCVLHLVVQPIFDRLLCLLDTDQTGLRTEPFPQHTREDRTEQTHAAPHRVAHGPHDHDWGPRGHRRAPAAVRRPVPRRRRGAAGGAGSAFHH